MPDSYCHQQRYQQQQQQQQQQQSLSWQRSTGLPPSQVLLLQRGSTYASSASATRASPSHFASTLSSSSTEDASSAATITEGCNTRPNTAQRRRSALGSPLTTAPVKGVGRTAASKRLTNASRTKVSKSSSRAGIAKLQVLQPKCAKPSSMTDRNLASPELNNPYNAAGCIGVDSQGVFGEAAVDTGLHSWLQGPMQVAEVNGVAAAAAGAGVMQPSLPLEGTSQQHSCWRQQQQQQHAAQQQESAAARRAVQVC
jgi:hypothetical protein